MKNNESNNVVITVLDTGISYQFSDIVYDSYELNQGESGAFTVCSKQGNDFYGHGTAIANIIYSISDDIKIINFKICNYDNEVTSQAITEALEYIYEKLDVDIINISAGATYIDDYFKMKNICKKLYDKGVVIVSAFDNDGAVSYPAAFESVIGIDSSSEYRKAVAVSDSIINVIMPQKYYRTYWNDGKKTILCGNSFACAYFSGIYGKYLKDYENSDVHRFIRNFTAHSIRCKKTKGISNPGFSIKKAIVFHINKESHMNVAITQVQIAAIAFKDVRNRIK